MHLAWTRRQENILKTMGPTDHDPVPTTFPSLPRNDGEVLARKLSILYTNLPGALAVNVVVAMVVSLVVYGPQSRIFLTVWLAAAGLLAFARAADLAWHRFRPQTTPSGRRFAVLRYHIGTGLQGLLWGTISFVLIPISPPVERLFLLLVVSAMAGGGVSYLAAIPSMYLTFMVPTLLPGCVRLLQSADMVQRSAGMLGVVYALAMVFATGRTGRWIDNSVRSELDNETLIADQKRANAELAKSRDDLETEVADRTADLRAANTKLTREVAEKERSRQEAEQTNRRFRELTEMLPEIVFETDSGGAITYVNRKFFELTGHSSGSLPSLFPATALVTPAEAGRFREMLFDLARGRSHPPTGFSARRTDDSTFPVLMVCTPIERGGDLHGVRGLAIDMTLQQELEARVRDSSKMEALGTLAGGVAHDFNNILAIILGQVEIVLKTHGEAPGLGSPLGRIAAASERAKQLVNQILTFARRHEGQPVPVDLGAEVLLALDLVSASLPPTITLQREVDEGIAIALGIPTQFQQVILNLCANATHAMARAGGTLTVALRTLELKEDVPTSLSAGRYAQLQVSDTGSGIPDRVLEHIFEPFYTTKDAGEGTGMGLSVVHGVVTGCGGAIQVDSAEGHGTTFRVFLPLSTEALAPRARPPEPFALQGSERVLVVDDQDTVREVVADGLEMFGYTTSRVGSGEEALAQLDQGGYQAVVTDHSMPGISGTQLAAINHARSGPPVVVYTGDRNTIPPGALQDGSIAAVLQKPVKPEELAGTIRQVIREGFRVP